ncbi:MAG TPA: sigma-54 dependent transcriptional regulator [Xanthomonadales bacterium]|nr:sigma-54 dependent transcriptional regulator [Xanthomonadales bacterium]
MSHVLIVDDDQGFCRATTEFIRLKGANVETASSLAEARLQAERNTFRMSLIDLGLPDGSGFELIESGDPRFGNAVVMTGSHSVQSAIRALHAPAPVQDYLLKPFRFDALDALLERCLGDVTRPDSALQSCGALLGNAPAMLCVYEQIRRVAPADASVLIVGESGCGKELAARAIHDLSGRGGEFVAVNCGAVHPELLASQLFGHERGSFTGAVRSHQGYFERAAGGTLFLDEITEMPPNLQVHLLRVLETRSFTRLGGTSERTIDVRVIAATNRDPHAAIASGALREDLFYRLNDFPLDMPALRERVTDIVPLAGIFLHRLNERGGVAKRFSPETAAALRAYPWPGNVRELRNVVSRAWLLADDVLHAAPLLKPRTARGERRNGVTFEVGTTFEDVERRMLMMTLEHFGGDKVEAARALGVTVKTIYNRLARYQGDEPSGA